MHQLIKDVWDFISKPEHANAIIAIFTAMIFLSSLAYTVFSAFQWCATKAGANAARENANAARLNTEALMSSERPWVLLDWESGAPRIHPPYLVPIEDNPNAYASCCHYYARNFGRTPAKVLSGKAVLMITEDPIVPEIDIDKLDAGAEFESILPQGETRAGEARLPTMFISKSDHTAVANGTRYLWIFGILRYADTFVRENSVEPYKMTFCCFWETRTNAPQPFWQFGPQIYNRAT